ncbi:DNA-directed RNA polymerase I subunit RPA43 [Orchesella cincta]|uniref:DNA-directed RNA polymerase I subunit RPA43 n=1 Tax=Orchesella cincta TaxID=48709 RepID=A0A1D2MA47_ORCCI|nr:DNA-directed RNA polymerase I subunit RPA43 [Orchesella cincta]
MMNTTILPDRFISEVQFSKEELQAVVDSGLVEVIDNHQQHIAVQPCWIHDLGSGVMEEINANVLGKWDKKLNAYVVYAENVRNFDSSAGMNEDHRWLHIDVSATFYIYTPEVGQQLKGEIKKVGDKAAVCMLFDVFTVTVFPNNEAELQGWNVGEEIHFRVLSFQHRRKGPIIRAKSFQDPSSFHNLSSNNSKKRKRSLTPQTPEEIDTSIITRVSELEDEIKVEDTDSFSIKKRKKSKKDKSKEKDIPEDEPDVPSSGRYVRSILLENDNTLDEEIHESSEELLTPKKKKKKKKSKK